MGTWLGGNWDIKWKSSIRKIYSPGKQYFHIYSQKTSHIISENRVYDNEGEEDL